MRPAERGRILTLGSISLEFGRPEVVESGAHIRRPGGYAQIDEIGLQSLHSLQTIGCKGCVNEETHAEVKRHLYGAAIVQGIHRERSIDVITVYKGYKGCGL